MSSRPEVRIKCHWCTDTFDTNRDMKNHAASEKHSMLRVICPWCTDEEKSYRRMTELQKHAEKRHSSLTIETGKEFFSESNGFYLSVKPDGYRHIIKPKEFDSLIAMKARAEVSRWLHRVKKPSRSMDQWEEGWKLVRPKPEHTPKSSSIKPKERTPVYSPRHPGLTDFELELAHLTFTSGENVAFMKSNTGNSLLWFRVELSTSVFDDKRAADNLLRRMRSCPAITGIPSDFEKELRLDAALAIEISKQLGISDKHIKKVYRKSISFDTKDKSTCKTKKRKLEIELEIEDNVELEDHKPVSPIQSPGSETTSQTSTASSSIVDLTLQPPATIYQATPCHNEVQPESTTPPQKLESEVTVVGYIVSNDPDAQMEDSMEIRKIEHPGQEILIATPNGQRKSIQDRAEDLLRTGVMPLLPPARREWEGVEPVELISSKCRITWPPLQWKELTPEERLTAWMSTAMALEFHRGVTMITNRTRLLDRYSMLTLSGTIVEKGEHNDETPVRLLNYNILKNIYLGRINGAEAESWLYVLEAARQGADKSAEHFGLQKINHVPLRLVESTDASI